MGVLLFIVKRFIANKYDFRNWIVHARNIMHRLTHILRPYLFHAR